MIHPHTRLAWIDDLIGLGVVATRRIPAGTVTWVRDPLDLVLTPGQVKALGGPYTAMFERYAYWEAEGLVLCWDHARFVNHHCEASCLGVGDSRFEIAVRDIEEGEQLTDDYATFGVIEPMACTCGAPTCRGAVEAGDLSSLRRGWATAYAGALGRVDEVAQPLGALAGRAVREVQHRAMSPRWGV